MINRLDNICEAVLKGKWPVNRRQMFDFQGLIPSYTPVSMDSPLQKRSFAELSMVGQASISGSEDITTSPQLSKVHHSHLLLQLGGEFSSAQALLGSLCLLAPPRLFGSPECFPSLGFLFLCTKCHPV